MYLTLRSTQILNLLFIANSNIQLRFLQKQLSLLHRYNDFDYNFLKFSNLVCFYKRLSKSCKIKNNIPSKIFNYGLLVSGVPICKFTISTLNTLYTVLAVLLWDLSKAVKTLLILLSFFFLKKSHYGQPYLRPMSTIRQIVTLFLLSEELQQELIYYKE